jgi:hypothetical protein
MKQFRFAIRSTGDLLKVRAIIRGDVVSEVDVETPWGSVTSVITSNSARPSAEQAPPQSSWPCEVTLIDAIWRQTPVG